MKRRTIKNFENQKTGRVTNGTSANRIRAALALRGMSLGAWAKKRGYSRNTVWQAAYKLRAGKLSRRIHAELEQLLDA